MNGGDRMAKEGIRKKASELRKRAEKILAEDPQTIRSMAPADIQKLIHELNVHQIELEMQNAELRRVQLELQEARDKYLNLYDFAPIGYFTLDHNSLIVDANLGGTELLGSEKHRLIGSQFTASISPDSQDTFYFHYREVLKTGLKGNCKLKMLKADGTPFHAQLISLASPEKTGNTNHCRVAVIDITERERAEEVLRQNQQQQQQLQIRDQFLSRMSHELRSPLTPIHQFVTILLDGLAGDLNDEQREYMQIILRNVNALRKMVSDLLEVTRAESGKLSVSLRCVYLAELIPQIFETFQLANSKELRLSCDVPGNLPPVCTDPDRVRQILDNLLDNAVKFTPEKGEISIRAQVLQENPEIILITVTDTGRGIAESEHEKIFEYLYQVKDDAKITSKGLGIGLYICRELVSSLGGRIWVKSQPGHGSTFFFTLPVFSMERQLASVVETADLTMHSVALITIEVSHTEERQLLRKPDKTALRDAWYALQSYAVPSLVLLLPRGVRTVSKEFFFIAASVDQSGIEVLVEELMSRLVQCQSFREADLNSKVSSMLLDTRSKSNRTLSKKLVNERVVEHIQDLMKTTLLNR
ncbi:MAG TPA: ATP-binding protein [Dehalococcoidales bacterium]